MAIDKTPKRVFVAGATGFVGQHVVRALLASGAAVTALVPTNTEIRMSSAEGLRIVSGDPWNRGSLSGRSRGHNAVIHLVGSMKPQPSRGLTYRHLNVASLQNITRMAISDGVQHLLFLSTSGAPWIPSDYARSKQEAEQYLRRSGMNWTIVRAPLVFPRGSLRNPTLLAFDGLSAVPLLGRPFARWAPLPVDTVALGITQLALQNHTTDQVVFGHGIRRMARELQAELAGTGPQPEIELPDTTDEMPFGWLPGPDRSRKS